MPLRFGDLVRNSGRPEMVSLWTDPNRDRAFMAAVKKNRVLTVFQEPSSKKRDFGQIGFHQDKFASYLVFPRPLPADSKSRVIGINYQLVEEPVFKNGAAKLTARPAKSKVAPITPRKFVAPTPEKSVRRKKSYDITMRRSATLETTVTVRAFDADTAKDLARKVVRKQAFDLARAIYHEEILHHEEHLS